MVFYDDFLKENGLNVSHVSDICQGMSYRSYKRIHLVSGETKVLMLTPVDKPLEDGGSALEHVIRPFVKVNAYLKNLGLHVPEIFAVDEEKGLVLLEDLGEKTFYDAFHNVSQTSIDEKLYEQVIDDLVTVYKAKPMEDLPHYRPFLATIRGEFFLDDYLPAVRATVVSQVERVELHNILVDIYNVVAKAPWGTILWDYHSPNLMMPTSGQNKAGVVDYQDAKYGPLSYDLASLLYDARYPFPKDLREKLFNRFVEKAGVEDVQTFKDSFEMCALLRSLGILGRFARSAFRDKRTEFIGKIAVLWPYMDEILENPHAFALKQFLQRTMEEKRLIAG